MMADGEEDDDASRILRCDIARGLVRISEAPVVLDPKRDAPPFAIPFEMLEPTMIPRLLLDAVWVLSNIKTITEKGEGNAFMMPVEGFELSKSQAGCKRVIHRVSEDGAREQVNEISLQIRLYEASARARPRRKRKQHTTTTTTTSATTAEEEEEEEEEELEERELREHYAVLVAQSPLPFSLRKAAYTTTRSVQRLAAVDARGADERRRVWAQLAMHVRGALRPHMHGANLMQMYESSMDWMRSGEADGFTCLFSMQRAFDWMKARFVAKHRGTMEFLSPLTLHGVGTRLSLQQQGDEEEEAEDFFVGPVFRDECRQYDEDVDRACNENNNGKDDDSNNGGGGQRRKRGRPPLATTNRRGRGRRRGGDNEAAMGPEEDELMMEEDGGMYEREGESTAPRWAVVRPCAGVELTEEGGARGLPGCVAAMRVVVRTSVESGGARLTEFRQQMRTFPESVMLELLRGQMQLPEDLLRSMNRQMRAGTLEITACDMRDVVMGDTEYNLGRPRLSHGDAAWGRQMMATMKEMGGARERLETLGKFMQMGFGLCYTRSKGSDSYTNGRVAMYGRYLTFENGELSRRECNAAYVDMRLQQGNTVEGSAMTGALRYAMDTVLACDRCVWNLRPDNLHLFMQLMVSDLMLCLNYWGGVISGASNGIGATVVIRDGGGSFHRWFKDPMSGSMVLGQVMNKDNGSGADYCVGAYKKAVSIGEYDERFRMQREFITEMKRVTETSLIQETCNTIEWRGNTPTIKNLIEETDDRKYSTELKAGGDQQSLNNLQAITWLIPRFTAALLPTKYTSTRGDADTNERIRVEYHQAKDGYWVLCCNNVREGARERVHTMMAVSRSVVSSAAGIEIDDVMQRGESDESFVTGLRREARHHARNGRLDRAAMSGQEADFYKVARPTFFVGMATAVSAGFIQWTGMLEQIREPRTTRALLQVFDAQLELCKDLLNPDFANSNDRRRFIQVSKARGVALALFGVSMRETMDIGRRDLTQQAAVEQAALNFKLEGAASTVSWYAPLLSAHSASSELMLKRAVCRIMGDTLEHMFRLDLMLVLVMLGRLLRVPTVRLDALLAWLRTGERRACPQAEAFFQQHNNQQGDGGGGWEATGRGFVQTGLAEDARGLLPMQHGLYLTCPLLRIPLKVSAGTPEARTLFCKAVGARLHREFSDVLRRHTRVDDSEEGDEMVHAMFERLVNRPCAWPSVFGDSGTLGDFWKGRAPPQPTAGVLRNNPALLQELARLTLPPLRMIVVENTVAQLGVDLRWMLLMNALTGGQLSQSSRFPVVAHMVQRLYRHCVPREMVPGRELFLGLPSQVTGTGFLWPKVLDTARRSLRRPDRSVGMDAPCRSGMVEDMGAAAPRYEMAHMLGVDERDVPTECVHYELPHAVWMPALLDGVPGAVRWENGRLWVWGEGLAEAKDVTVDIATEAAGPNNNVTNNNNGGDREDDEEATFYFGGRSTVPIRPVCAFYRPGIVVRLGPRGGGAPDRVNERLGVVGRFEPASGRYRVVFFGGGAAEAAEDEEERLTPYEIQEAMLLPDALVACKLRCIVASARVQFQRADGTVLDVIEAAEEDEYGDQECVGRLDYQGEDDDDDDERVGELPAGCVGLRLPRIVSARRAFRADDADEQPEDEEEEEEEEASHGQKARQAYEDRHAPRLWARIEGLRTLDESLDGEDVQPDAFVRCRPHHDAGGVQ